MHEVLLNKEEMAIALDLDGYYRIPPDLRDMNYGKYVENGDIKLSNSIEYSSKNTTQLNSQSLKELLLKVDFVKDVINRKEIKDKNR